MNIKGKKICFLGDSITEGWGASHPSKCFVGLFQECNKETINSVKLFFSSVAVIDIKSLPFFVLLLYTFCTILTTILANLNHFYFYLRIF